MAIPDFQSAMLPILKQLGDGQEHTTRDSYEHLASFFNLTDEEKEEMLPSGAARLFDNRLGWARTHMKKAGLIDSLKRSVYRITEKGKRILEQNPPIINVALLRQFPDYIDFITNSTSASGSSPQEFINTQVADITPEESLEQAYITIRKSLAQDIIQKAKSCSPAFFERLVIELLVKMGYGGSLQDAGRAIGRSGDEGIDGIIKEDKLGLDVIYVQAKRWNSTVGRPEIQSFVGALAGQGAKKGVFITTSTFSSDAKAYIPRNDTKIVLVDGEQLAQYMIDYDLGVSHVTAYEVKKIDLDYFEQE